MKILKQLGIVFGLYWVSQIIESVLPFTFPASIIGMLILLAALIARVLRPEQLRESADYLVGNLGFFFIPAAVSILNYVDLIRSNAVQLVIVCAVSMVLTFLATTMTVRFTCWLMKRGGVQ
ncbi:MAG: CidA/LrgA family protein [Oscillibacter sp.]|jgi:holin-like protein|nr:CidA/LrgA family protein [Oscillibacter sp.]